MEINEKKAIEKDFDLIEETKEQKPDQPVIDDD